MWHTWDESWLFEESNGKLGAKILKFFDVESISVVLFVPLNQHACIGMLVFFPTHQFL